MKRKKLAEKPISKLTKKQRGFVKDYLETGNGTKAALNNYDTDNPKVAQVIASENLSKPMIVNALAEALPDELLAQVHLEGLSAYRTWGYGDDAREEPDYATRHRYLDSAYKLKGSYAPEKSVALQVNFTPDPKLIAVANEFEEKLKSSL